MSINPDESRIFSGIYQNFTTALNDAKSRRAGYEDLTLSDACLKSIHILATQRLVSPSSQDSLIQIERALESLKDKELSALSDEDITHITTVFKRALGLPSAIDDSGIETPGVMIYSEFEAKAILAETVFSNPINPPLERIQADYARLRRLAETTYSQTPLRFPLDQSSILPTRRLMEETRPVSIQEKTYNVPRLFLTDQLEARRSTTRDIYFGPSFGKAVKSEEDAKELILECEQFAQKIASKDNKEALFKALLIDTTQHLSVHLASCLQDEITYNLLAAGGFENFGFDESSSQVRFFPVTNFVGIKKDNQVEVSCLYHLSVAKRLSLKDGIPMTDAITEAKETLGLNEALGLDITANFILTVDRGIPSIKNLRFSHSIGF